LKKIAVIGTGLSALSLAHHLPSLDITFFEKSWRPGGRISTRRHQDYAFDHGAHYIKEDHGVLGFNEYLEKINATKVLNGTFCSNIQNQSPLEEKRVIVGQKGIESIPLEFHKKLRYPTEFSTHIKKIESRKPRIKNLVLMILFLHVFLSSNQKIYLRNLLIIKIFLFQTLTPYGLSC